MSELNQIDTRENIGVMGLPQLPDLSSLGQLQKYPAAPGEMDFGRYVRDYLNQNLGMAENTTGQGVDFFGPVSERDRRAEEQYNAEHDALVAAGDAIGAQQLQKSDYLGQNFETLRGDDFTRWLENTGVLAQVPEAMHPMIYEQFEEIYTKEFQEKFHVAQNRVSEVAAQIRTQNNIESSVQSGDTMIRRGLRLSAELEYDLAALDADRERKLEEGLPFDGDAYAKKREELVTSLADAQASVAQGAEQYQTAQTLIATGSAYQYFDADETEVQTKKAQQSMQMAWVEGNLEAAYRVEFKTALDVLVQEYAYANGLSADEVDPVGLRAQVEIPLAKLKEMGQNLVGELPGGAYGLNEAELNQIVDDWATMKDGLESDWEQEFREISEDRSYEFWKQAYDITSFPRMDGNNVPAGSIPAAMQLLDTLNVMSDRRAMDIDHINPIRKHLEGFLAWAGSGGEEDIPDEALIAMEQKLDTIERQAYEHGTNRESLLQNIADIEVTMVVDGEERRYSIPYSMYKDRANAYDISEQYQSLHSEIGRMVMRADGTRQATRYIQEGQRFIQLMNSGSINEDEALQQYRLSIMGVENEEVKNRTLDKGRAHFDIATGQTIPAAVTDAARAQEILAAGREYDHEYLGSMLSEDGLLVFGREDIFYAATQARYGDEGANWQMDAMRKNIDSRLTGFSEGQYMTVVNKGIYSKEVIGDVQVEGFLANVYVQGYKEDVYGNADEKTPQLRLLNGKERGENVEYYVYTDPHTGEIRIRNSTATFNAKGELTDLTLNEAMDGYWGMNEDVRRELHQYGGSLVAQNHTWEREQEAMMYYNRRTSQAEEAPAGMPDAARLNIEKYQEVPNPYQIAAMFFGEEREVSQLDYMLTPSRVASASAEAGRYRAIGMTKDLVDEEESVSGVFFLPSSEYFPAQESVNARGRTVKEPENINPTEWTDEYGDFVRVPKDIAEQVRNLYFAGEFDEAWEMYRDYINGDLIGAPRRF